MRMAQRVHTDASHEIQIGFAIEVIDITALAAMKSQRVACIILHQVGAFEMDDFFKRRRGNRLLRQRRGHRWWSEDWRFASHRDPVDDEYGYGRHNGHSEPDYGAGASWLRTGPDYSQYGRGGSSGAQNCGDRPQLRSKCSDYWGFSLQRPPAFEEISGMRSRSR